MDKKNTSNSYPGGKGSSGTYQRILDTFPKHNTFYELFAGSAKLSKKKKAASTTILIEKNPQSFSQLEKYFNVGSFPDESIKILNINAFDYITNTLLTKHKLLQDNNSTLLYLDPPYPHSTRVDHGLYGPDYELTDEQHKELLNLCNLLSDRDFLVCISTYPNEMYEKHLIEWNYIDYNSTKRNGSKIERLYFNYSYPIWNKHEYTFAGNNYREREQIRQKAKRYVNKFTSMPELQKAAIVDALYSNELIKLTQTTKY